MFHNFQHVPFCSSFLEDTPPILVKNHEKSPENHHAAEVCAFFLHLTIPTGQIQAPALQTATAMLMASDQSLAVEVLDGLEQTNVVLT